jgi:hypothetical protein
MVATPFERSRFSAQAARSAEVSVPVGIAGSSRYADTFLKLMKEMRNERP